MICFPLFHSFYGCICDGSKCIDDSSASIYTYDTRTQSGFAFYAHRCNYSMITFEIYATLDCYMLLLYEKLCFSEKFEKKNI